MRMFFRRVLLSLSLLTVLTPSLAALPASAENVQFYCWCQNTETRVCDGRFVDSGIANDDAEWASWGVTLGMIPVIGSATVAGISGAQALDQAFNDTPAARAKLVELKNRCITTCRDRGQTAIHFETTQRMEICRECNPAVGSACNERDSGRRAFGAEAIKAAIAQCEDRKAATNLLPIHLAIPIGGVDQVNGLPDYINIAYRYMVTIVLVVAIVMVVYGGFRYLVGASMGDIQAGKKIIQDAIVGMLLVLGAYTILSTINPATTILSFKGPEAINCQDLALPDVLKNARCSGDAECGAGKLCVLAKNVFVSPGNIANMAIAGGVQAGVAGRSADEAGGLASYLGDGVADSVASKALKVWPPAGMGLMLLLAGDRSVAALGGNELAAGAIGVAGGVAVGTSIEMYRSSTNIHVCSTGEQGSPCASIAASGAYGVETGSGVVGSSSCRAGLTCVESWGMCWPKSGNAPGMPCDTNEQCSNNRCVSVEGTNYKVCEIAVQNGTPCAFVEGALNTFPIQCNGSIQSGLDFTCAYCPSGAGGVSRNWGALPPGRFPGIPTSGQCKPLAALGTSCAP